MVLIMKISWLKYQNDDISFKVPEKLGFDVFKLNKPEEVDNKMEELIQKNYTTIILTNELASFSDNLLKKYERNRDINIIIARSKE